LDKQILEKKEKERKKMTKLYHSQNLRNVNHPHILNALSYRLVLSVAVTGQWACCTDIGTPEVSRT
jgi:hypothetical protein